MSEFVVIQVGQCGNQIGSALWPLILQEYDINLYSEDKKKTGDTLTPKPLSSFFNTSSKSDLACGTLAELINNKVKARAVCIDMEDSVVARFRQGVLKDIFDKKCFITNYPGSGNNWAEGYYEYGPIYAEKILSSIKHAVERCDSLHGFLLLFSTGGGTGSGLGTFVLKLLADCYPEIERFVACVYPTGTEDVVTCPYNMGFATKELLDNATCVFPVENRSLLDIVERQAKKQSGDISSLYTPFNDMNNIIVNMLLHVTSGSRFPGSLNFDMNELNTNMVPFPKLNFLSSGFNPCPYSSLKNGKKPSKQLKDELFVASCSRLNQLVKVDPLGPKSVLMATTLIGRGGFSLSDMNGYVEKIQNKGKFAPWAFKSIKLGLCDVPPKNATLAMFSLHNTTSVVNLFDHIHGQFTKLYKKKAHVHHYTKISGFDRDFFLDCHESFRGVINAYREIENMSPVKIPRLTPLKDL
ncbi:tubulin epsilon chain-like [Anoplophora glabripennis]|uniref:tubulin epsilon chain-like n=1 Tax=Anoplophora glabripennis TaxID=217634 RepID=UPI0008745017|nr:tubulin epsilon chain-like [Anoplophora glabripennis]